MLSAPPLQCSLPFSARPARNLRFRFPLSAFDNATFRWGCGFAVLRSLLFCLISISLVATPLLAQQTNKPQAPQPDDIIIAKARELRTQNQTPSGEIFGQLLKNPKSLPVHLVPKSTTPLKGRELGRIASAAYVRIGWVFQCTKCNHWHLNLAGGYAIAKDTVVTAQHVVTPPERVKKGTGFPVVVRGEDEVLSITGVLAGDEATDAVVLRVDCSNLSPLPLAGEIEVGDPVYCLSDPDGHRGIFTSGIVNHMEVAPGNSMQAQANNRITVSTDWAPGSSGAAILDICGNAVGHVSTIEPITCEEDGPSDSRKGKRQPASAVVMSLHEAVPATSVQALLQQPNTPVH
jgi:hypothetical protein